MATTTTTLIDTMREHHKAAPAAERLVLEVLDSHRTIGTVATRKLRGKAGHYSVLYERRVAERLETLERLGLVERVEGCCGRGRHWQTK
jgi:hypothetical protein